MGNLRIVGGELGGRRFPGPKGAGVRPTGERVREAIASALESRDAIAGAVVLDLFAGTGALAFEALSRGAERATLVDRDRRVIAALERSARALGLQERVRVRAMDLLGAPERVADRLAEDGPFDLIFADPPYAEVARIPPLIGALMDAGVARSGAWIVVEHASRQPPGPSRLASVVRYRYGDTALEVGRVPS